VLFGGSLFGIFAGLYFFVAILLLVFSAIQGLCITWKESRTTAVVILLAVLATLAIPPPHKGTGPKEAVMVVFMWVVMACVAAYTATQLQDESSNVGDTDSNTPSGAQGREAKDAGVLMYASFGNSVLSRRWLILIAIILAILVLILYQEYIQYHYP
jgi:hypothetical protein